MEPDTVINISPVIESCYAKAFLDRHRNTQFRVDDEQLVSSHWHTDQRASRLVCRVTAGRNHTLWSSSVEREPAQCAATAREKLLAQWNMAVGKCLLQSNAQTISPNHSGRNLFVISCLPQQPDKIHVRAQRGGIEVKFKALVDASVSVKRIVTRVACECS